MAAASTSPRQPGVGWRGRKGEMKWAFVFCARNLIPRKKDGQGGRRHVCGVLLNRGNSSPGLAHLPSRQRTCLMVPFHLTAWIAAGAWAGLGPRGHRQMVSRGMQKVWCVLVQVQSPGGGVGETVHLRDSEPSISLTCPSGENWEGSMGVKQHESPFPLLPCRSSLCWPLTQDPAPQDLMRPALMPL